MYIASLNFDLRLIQHPHDRFSSFSLSRHPKKYDHLLISSSKTTDESKRQLERDRREAIAITLPSQQTFEANQDRVMIPRLRRVF